MQITKRELEPIFLAVKGTEGVLSLKDARVRDSFMKPLTEALMSFEKERNAVYDQFCIKTEDGQPDLSDGSYHFDKGEIEKVNEELKTLIAEPVELTPPAGLKEILERSEYKPRVGEVEIIDSFINAL
jgi:hypothetical protein